MASLLPHPPLETMAGRKDFGGRTFELICHASQTPSSFPLLTPNSSKLYPKLFSTTFVPLLLKNPRFSRPSPSPSLPFPLLHASSPSVPSTEPDEAEKIQDGNRKKSQKNDKDEKEEEMKEKERMKEENFRKLSLEEHWEWHKPHFCHWHGQWILWEPLKSTDFSKSYRSVRSLISTNEEKTEISHKNQWYNASGDLAWQWEGGPWEMSLTKNSVDNGIVHPQSPSHRVLCLGVEGEAVWTQMRVEEKEKKAFCEVFFTYGPNARFSVPVGFDEKGTLLVGLLLEDAKNSGERQNSEWKGDMWQHPNGQLISSRTEPNGVYVGEEVTITDKLEVVTKKERNWEGFSGGLSGNVMENYHFTYLPNEVTVCTPKEREKFGKVFAFVVTWVVSESEIRQMSVLYKENGDLEHVKGGKYYLRV